MSEYNATKKEVCKFLGANLEPLIRRSGIRKIEFAENLGVESSALSYWCNGSRQPSNPNSLLRLYSLASATEKDYAALRKIITVSPEELESIKQNNSPERQIRLSLSSVNTMLRKRDHKIPQLAKDEMSLNSKYKNHYGK
jgi:transcriptional regulator with XRE-family HTH domain